MIPVPVRLRWAARVLQLPAMPTAVRRVVQQQPAHKRQQLRRLRRQLRTAHRLLRRLHLQLPVLQQQLLTLHLRLRLLLPQLLMPQLLRLPIVRLPAMMQHPAKVKFWQLIRSVTVTWLLGWALPTGQVLLQMKARSLAATRQIQLMVATRLGLSA